MQSGLSLVRIYSSIQLLNAAVVNERLVLKHWGQKLLLLLLSCMMGIVQLTGFTPDFYEELDVPKSLPLPHR